MRNDIYLFCYISSANSISHFFCSVEGSRFFQCLKERDVGHSLYLKYGIDTRVVSVRGDITPQFVSAEQLRVFVGQVLKSHKTLLFISDSEEAIFSLSGKEGCLPFLLTEKGKPNLDNKEYIQINSLSSLFIYFEQSFPHYVMTLLRRKPDDYKTEIRSRNRMIEEQIKETGGIYIFGAYHTGKIVYEECLKTGIRVFGFVDNDPFKQNSKLYDLPVYRPIDLDPDCDVVTIASGNYSYDIYKQLQDFNFQYVQNLSEFFFFVNCLSQPEIFFHEDLWQNRIRYHAFYAILADATSRNALDKIIGYRQCFDITLPASICDKQNLQWFDKTLFIPNAGHVFVDGGAFDGDTALRFMNVNGNRYDAIHLFEPDPSIAQKASENLRGYARVYVHNLGLSDNRGKLFFSHTGRMDGHLSQEGGIPVEIDSIDNVVQGRVTLIKLDIEGAEESAIAGAARHIRDDSPMLAIAVYHKAEDLWAVPRKILGINPDYAFYLRHYTQISHDTVLYGVAKST